LTVRQWVLSLPKRLRYHLAPDPDILNTALHLFLGAIEQGQRQGSPGASNQKGRHFGRLFCNHRTDSAVGFPMASFGC
jgi:hypothetical protein